MTSRAKTDDRPVLTTFYDGECPVCRPEIDHLKRLGRRAGRRLAWRDVARDPDALALFGVDAATAKRRLHVLDRQGTLYDGIDAFAALWSELPSHRWLARLVQLPVIHLLAGVLYDRGIVVAVERLKHGREARRQIFD